MSYNHRRQQRAVNTIQTGGKTTIAPITTVKPKATHYDKCCPTRENTLTLISSSSQVGESPVDDGYNQLVLYEWQLEVGASAGGHVYQVNETTSGSIPRWLDPTTYPLLRSITYGDYLNLPDDPYNRNVVCCFSEQYAILVRLTDDHTVVAQMYQRPTNGSVATLLDNPLGDTVTVINYTEDDSLGCAAHLTKDGRYLLVFIMNSTTVTNKVYVYYTDNNRLTFVDDYLLPVDDKDVGVQVQGIVSGPQHNGSYTIAYIANYGDPSTFTSTAPTLYSDTVIMNLTDGVLTETDRAPLPQTGIWQDLSIQGDRLAVCVRNGVPKLSARDGSPIPQPDTQIRLYSVSNGKLTYLSGVDRNFRGTVPSFNPRNSKQLLVTLRTDVISDTLVQLYEIDCADQLILRDCYPMAPCSTALRWTGEGSLVAFGSELLQGVPGYTSYSPAVAYFNTN